MTPMTWSCYSRKRKWEKKDKTYISSWCSTHETKTESTWNIDQKCLGERCPSPYMAALCWFYFFLLCFLSAWNFFFLHKIRQGYAFCNLFCAYIKLVFFFFSLLPFDPSVSSAFHLPPRLWRTDATAWIKSFFLHISAGLLRHFFSYAAIYPACKYKHVYSTLSRILKPPSRHTVKSRRLCY